jgi:tRNA (guanine6-N2)-methyltransferase
MARRQATTESLPACYVLSQPGLESVAAEEIRSELGGDIKKTTPGAVVFRVPQIDQDLLQLRTVEDVFLLAWGTDQLSYRATDLERISRWTAQDARWDRLLQYHHAIRPKPKGKPTYRLVAQMTGEHGYRRTDARKALAEGLAGKLPSSWKHAEENAAVEIWLTINGATAVCGLRLSDRTMRHRTYKLEHQPASLRPTVAAAMARLGEIKSGQVVIDPMCGAGTILAEVFELGRQDNIRHGLVLGGDIEISALRAANPNLRPLGQAALFRWEATRLPLADRSVDRILCNPPFGKQLASPEIIPGLYRRLLLEWQRVLRPRGRAVVLVSDFAAIKRAAEEVRWRAGETVRLQVLGQRAVMGVWHPIS